VWSIVNLEVWDISRAMARQAIPCADRPGAGGRRAELEMA
jgi:hypothetical protein